MLQSSYGSDDFGAHNLMSLERKDVKFQCDRFFDYVNNNLMVQLMMLFSRSGLAENFTAMLDTKSQTSRAVPSSMLAITGDLKSVKQEKKKKKNGKKKRRKQRRQPKHSKK